MNYFILIVVIVGLFLVIGKRYDYLKNTSGAERTKRKVFFGLVMAFTTFVGITSVFADALFELIGVDKPAQFEWLSFGAFCVLAIAGVKIVTAREKGDAVPVVEEVKKEVKVDAPAPVVEEVKEEVKVDAPASGAKNTVSDSSLDAGGDIHIGDKVEGDKIEGDKVDTKIVNLLPIKKIGKELTVLNKTNPDDIIGRAKDLDELQSLLFNNQKVVVNGLGGIGKTTLAEAYIFKYNKYYKHIAWITNGDNLINDFVQNTDLIENLQIDVIGMQPQDIFRKITQKMRDLDDYPNLLVIDNVTKKIEGLLRQLPSPPNWHLLVTSREIIEEMYLKELGFLSPEDAIRLFQKYATHITDMKEIAEIVKTIDYHTLSIEILAKTAKTRQTDVTKLKNALKQNIKAGVKTKHSVSKIEKIMSYLSSIFDLSDINELESELLRNLSLLPPEFHSRDLIHFLIREEDKDQEDFNATLTDLHEKGWILYNAETDSYKMHRVIGEVVYQKLRPTSENVSYLISQITSELSIDQTKENPVDKFKWAPFGKIITDYFEESDETSIALLQSELALVLQAQGDYKGAKALFEKAVKSDEQNFGTEHPNTVNLYSNLGVVFEILGDYEGAKTLLGKALKSAKKNFGSEHRIWAVLYSNLALVLKALGDYKGAKTLLEKALISDEKNLGRNHPTTALRYSNLGMVLRDQGNFKGAKALLRKALELAEENLGSNHPTTALRYSNLALVLQALGDYEGAKTLLKKALKSNVKNLGRDHPATAVCYSSLGMVLRDQGNFKGAKALLKMALKSDEENFGTEHPNTVNLYSNLALILKALGDYKGAKTLLEKALKSTKKNFGTESPRTAVSSFNLALVLQTLGDYEGAKILLEKAMKSNEQNFGNYHPTTAGSYSNLACVLNDLGDYEGAKELLEKALKSDVQSFGFDHPATASRYYNLALVFKDLGNYEGAKELLEKAYDVMFRYLGDEHPYTKRAKGDLDRVIAKLSND